MQTLDLGEKRQLKLKWEGKEYLLNFPSNKSWNSYLKNVEDKPGVEQQSELIALLDGLGLPSKVSWDMEPYCLESIVKEFGADKKKIGSELYRKAKMLRFYSGFTDERLNAMDVRTFNEYYAAMEPLKAEEMISSIICSAYPHSSKKSQDKTWNKLNKLKSFIYSSGKSLAISSKEAFSRLARVL